MRLTIPSWAITPLMVEAVIRGNKIAELNDFPKLNRKQQEMLAQEVVKMVDKIKSKKQLKQLINSTQFDQTVYKALATVYTA